MDVTLLTITSMVVVATIAVVWRGGWAQLVMALKQAGRTMRMVWPRLLMGLTLGGLIQVLIPTSLVVQWLGPASGLKGILIGAYLGILLTGGPFVQLPIIASIYQAGAGAGPVIALLTAGNLLSLPMFFSWHIPFFGFRLASAQYIVALVAAPLIGLLGALVFRVFGA